MSRRSKRKEEFRGGAIEYVDGVLKLECPTRHPVGYLWRPDNGANEVIRLNAQRRNGVRITDQRPLRFSCPDCVHDGKRLDLQLSWQNANDLLADALADRTRLTSIHVLGG